MNPAFQAAGLVVFERGWLSSNSVLFAAGDAHEPVLVDSGYCTHAEQTVALVRRALGDRPLSRIVNTHLHSDHCGGNHALQLAFDCDIAVPIGDAEKVDRWDEDALTYRATGQRCPRFRRTQSLSAGTQIELGSRRWQVIAAPGHDPESIVLYEPESAILISADALWENGFGVVFPELDGIDAFDVVRATLKHLEQLPIRWVVPGHGAPFEHALAAIERAHRRLDKLIADPARHASHAARVLIKFHMLEVQSVAIPELSAWLAATPYLRLTHTKFFSGSAFADWCRELISELVASGAVSIQAGRVHNI